MGPVLPTPIPARLALAFSQQTAKGGADPFQSRPVAKFRKRG